MKRKLGIAFLLMALGGPIGWVTTSRLESNNEFCVACHLNEQTPLHEEKMKELMATPPVNLVSLHYQADSEFRCIQCHGGASFANQLRVKAVAARDALVYLLGRFEEPVSMDYPLWDEDCAQCHERYETERSDDFHAIEDHNLPSFVYRCVDCHVAHFTEGAAQFGFLEPARVRRACQTCHEEL